MLILIAIISICVVIFLLTNKNTKENFISDDEFKNMFEIHIKKFGYEKYKSSTSEYNKRFNIYKNNLLNYTDIGSKNKFKGGITTTKYTFQKGETQFSSWTPQEYQSLFYSDSPSCIRENFTNLDQDSRLYKKIISIELPSRFSNNYNLNLKNNQYDDKCIGQIRNQGYCGSCWAFAFISVLETIMYIDSKTKTKGNKYDITTPLSVQQIIDCTSSNKGCVKNRPNKGCEGGRVYRIVDHYLNKDTYICTDKYYPYTLNTEQEASNYNYPGCDDASKCNTTSKSLFFGPRSYLAPGLISYQISLTENEVKQAIYYLGPLCITIRCAVNPLFSQYIGGVYNGPSIYTPPTTTPVPTTPGPTTPGPTTPGPTTTPSSKIIHDIHKVVVCGWGYDSKLGEYWIFRNSWGSNYWGRDEGGFFKLPRNYSDDLIPEYDRKYGYGAMFKNMEIFKILDPCTAEITSQRRARNFVINIMRNPENNRNNRSYAMIEIFGEVDPAKYFTLTIYNISNETIRNEYIDANGNLIYNYKIIADDENNYYSDKKHTERNKDPMLNPYFYYIFNIEQDSIIFNYVKNITEEWTITAIGIDLPVNTRIEWFKHVINNYDFKTKKLTITIDKNTDQNNIDKIRIFCVSRERNTITFDIQGLNPGINNNIIMDFSTFQNMDYFYLCNDGDIYTPISNKYFK